MHQSTIGIPRNEIPVEGSYDVAVAGGGIAGIAAALSAARAGAKTILLEQQYALGGLATLGLIAIYLPLCDGRGRQVSFGIAEELLHLSLQLDDAHPKEKQWKNLVAGDPSPKLPRFETTYNPSMFSLLAEKLLLENGVEIRYGVCVSDVVMEGDKISAIVAQSRTGPIAFLAKSVVDATGDGLLCAMAGEKVTLFQQKNILAAWYYFVDGNKLRLQPLGAADKPDKYKTKEEQSLTQKRYVGLSSKELSEFTADAHQKILEHFSKGGPLTEVHQLAMLPTIPQIRMTQRLVGLTDLPEPDQPLRYEDSIGLIGNWKRRGPVYEIPFSCLHGSQVKNLITAGRCISAQDAMWDNTRVIPACAVTGEAAGLAAAISDDFTSIDLSQLQSQLRSRGILLHAQDL